MSTFQTAAVFFALSQVFLSLTLLLNTRHWSIQRRLYIALLIAVLAYLVSPMVTDSLLRSLLGSVSTAVPGLFWLTCASFFNDHFQLQRWQLVLVATTILLPALGKLLSSWGIMAPDWLTYTFPQALEFVLLALALFAVAQHWRGDLIEPRRRLRLWFCTVNGIYIFLLVLVREVLFPGADWMSGAQYLPVGLTLLATNAILLGYKHDILEENVEVSADSSVQIERAVKVLPEIDNDLVQKLQQVVGGTQPDGSDGAYREMGLTIGQLANRLMIPEYKVRQAISQGMTYRNFNDFLNSYRIKEASRRLANPEDSHIPVLTIALDAGFRSLSSFNKAFKMEFQATPTAYRKEHLSS